MCLNSNDYINNGVFNVRTAFHTRKFHRIRFSHRTFHSFVGSLLWYFSVKAIKKKWNSAVIGAPFIQKQRLSFVFIYLETDERRLPLNAFNSRGLHLNNKLWRTGLFCAHTMTYRWFSWWDDKIKNMDWSNGLHHNIIEVNWNIWQPQLLYSYTLLECGIQQRKLCISGLAESN